MDWAAGSPTDQFDPNDFVSPPSGMPDQPNVAPPPPDPSMFVPPTQGPFVPPQGRMYANDRLPPTWQPQDYLPHPASMGAMGEYFDRAMNGGALQEALGGLAQIAGGSAAGYLLTQDWAAAAGAGLAVAGFGQLPHVMGPSSMRRIALGGLCLAGAYLLLKGKSSVLQGSKSTPTAPWLKKSSE